MRMYDIIHKKRNGGILLPAEIHFWLDGVVNETIPDYQTSALLMAIYFKGMTEEEISELTLGMAASGDQVDLSPIAGVKVDKHSTGGVGDKTTLIIAPIAAACGVPVAKMSGRGLGHTGGTIDKLESIPGFRTNLSREEFLHVMQTVGAAVIGQSGNLCPADKKLYALRDVTATVESIPLIAASVMSKKIAAGADKILLDVKVGSGAFLKTREQAEELAAVMKKIGEQVGRQTEALITDMDKPLGRCIGNALEVKEACETLLGRGPADLTELCLTLAAHMIWLGEKANSLQEAEALARECIASGLAFSKFKEMVQAQGGDIEVLNHLEKLPLSPVKEVIKAKVSGKVTHLDAEACGIAAMQLGAGRETKESQIDYGAGIILHKNCGDAVQEGEVLAELYAATHEQCQTAAKTLQEAYRFA